MRIPCAAFLLLLSTGLACASSAPSSHRSVYVLWRTPLSTLGYAPDLDWSGTPASDGQMVFIDVHGAIVAVSARRGDVIWRTRYRAEARNGTAKLIAAYGQVLSVEPGFAFAMDAKTGAILWRQQLDSVTPSADIASDSSALYVGTVDARALALDRHTGRTLWSTQLAPVAPYGAYTSGLAVSGDTVYATVRKPLSESLQLRRGYVVALDRRTGSTFWTYETAGDKGDVLGEPAIVGTLLIVNTVAGHTGIDRFSGKKIWDLQIDSTDVPWKPKSAAVATAFFGVQSTSAFSVDPATGRLFWKTDVGQAPKQGVLCGNRLLIDNFDLVVIDPASGRILRKTLGGVRGTYDGVLTSNFGIFADAAFILSHTELIAIKCAYRPDELD